MIRFTLDYLSYHHMNVKDFIEAGYLSVEMRYQYLPVNMMYNIFMIRFHLIYASLKGLKAYTSTRQEAASCHMLFVKLK